MDIDTNTLNFFCEIDNILLLRHYITNSQLKRQVFNNLILQCCNLGRYKILQWLMTKQKKLLINKKEEINYNKPCFRALINKHFKIVKYILKKKDIAYSEKIKMFILCCENNYIDMAKFFYLQYPIKISSLTIKLNKNKNERETIKMSNWINNMIKHEKINDEFVSLCEIGLSDLIIDYYNNHEVCLDYNNYESLYILTKYKNNTVINWILSLNILPNEMLLLLFIRFCETDNLIMAKKIYKNIKSATFFQEINMNDLFAELLGLEKLIAIKNLHSFGFKIKDRNLIIITFMALCDPEVFDDLNFIKLYYDMYSNYLDEYGSGILFLNLCEFSSVAVVEYFHNKWKLFKNANNGFYIYALKSSCNSINIEVAEWLAELYQEYIIEIVVFEDVIYDCLFKKISKQKQLYKKIAAGQIVGLDQFKSLSIDKKIYIPENEIEDCCVCYTKPYNLLKLNCDHFCCISCLCNWYIEHPNETNICPYCRANTEFKKCFRIKSKSAIIMENIQNINILTKQKYSVTNNEYKELMKIKFNSF